MAAQTPAQEEFQAILNKQSRSAPRAAHPEDSKHNHDEDEEEDEESEFQAKRVEQEMAYTSGGGSGRLNLPPSSFDEGRTTGVKGVIADARSFESAKMGHKWKTSVAGSAAQSRLNGARAEKKEMLRDGGDGDEEDDFEDDEEFLEMWREERRLQIQREGNDIRNRRTSPSVRTYGRFDEVNALGYLDAIEKVGPETVVVVFVYDVDVSLLLPKACGVKEMMLMYPKCPVSQVIEMAITPLVEVNPAVHFVKVHYDEVDFDNAGVPAILAYRNQGDLFANLTYIIDQIPEDTLFDTPALKDVLVKHRII